jgi:pimeloyl-ACP methyl ester carboxylesterase
LQELAKESEVVDTAAGPIEIARTGSPPYVIHLHGTPGGYDQGLSLSEPFTQAGLGSIAVSRPGYLRTPISVGRSAAEQADALTAVLDALQIEKVAVQGVSGGGPSANQFAARHPDRCMALFLTCAVSAAYPIVIPGWSKIVMTPLGMRLSAWSLRKFPKATLKQLLKDESTFDDARIEQVASDAVANPSHMQFLYTLVQSSTPWEDRRTGFDADMETIGSLADEPLPLETIRCPTLIVHGSADADVPYAVGVEAHKRIAGSVLYTVENASHLLWIDEGIEEVNRQQADFAREHC